MFEPTPKGRQVFGQWAINADFRPCAWGMKITAGTDQQTELTGQNRQTADLIGRLQAVDHFYCVAAGLDEVGDQLATLAAGEIVMRRVRKADPGPGGAQGRHRFLKGRPVLLDVAQFARTKPFAERFGAIFDETLIDQKVGKMRSGRRIAAVAQRLLHRACTFERAGHTFHRQLSAYFFGPQPAARVQLLDGLTQLRGIYVESVAQYVNGGTAPSAGQFNAINQLHTQRKRRSTGLGQAFEGVVIGQREDFDAVLVGTRDKYRGRKGAIGSGTVAVQIDVHRGAFAVIDVCYYAVTSSFWLLL